MVANARFVRLGAVVLVALAIVAVAGCPFELRALVRIAGEAEGGALAPIVELDAG